MPEDAFATPAISISKILSNSDHSSVQKKAEIAPTTVPLVESEGKISISGRNRPAVSIYSSDKTTKLVEAKDENIHANRDSDGISVKCYVPLISKKTKGQ